MSPLPGSNIIKQLPPSSMNDTKSTSIDRSLHRNMTLECDRLATFKNGWPLKFLSDKQMAAAGFYFLCKKEDGRICDDVKCIYCGIELGKWVEGDDPLQDHEKWSPNCWFLRRMKKGTEDVGYDTCGSLFIQPSNAKASAPKVNQVVSSLKKLGINKNSPPAFPHYATFDSRLRTFDSWPISLRLKPNVLSEAGFFYTGKGDQTLCFRCGGGLKHWEETDDPWTEHARWFSSCPYVGLVKGQEFINQVIGVKESPSEPITLQDLNTVIRAHSEVKPTPSLMAISEPSASSTSSMTTARSSSNSISISTNSSSNSICSSTVSSSAATSVSTGQGSSPSSSQDGRLCKICYQREMGVVFLPCGHVVACVYCASALTDCAVCRQRFTATMRLFLS